jgi:UDP-N-acetylglucosamine--N-acetylmuramyl-(pentapeptide) pyrophosphoryl-undecaprenol N-acetylglucosamine transferase
MRETGPRIFLAGGGTGGHLYPGLAVAEAVLALRPGASIAFSSGAGAVDRKVLRGPGVPGFPVTLLASKPFRLRAPWTWPAFLVSLVRAGVQARRRFREFCPDVVVGLGGYASYAPVRVGQKYGAATAVLNPDIIPGRANRRLARRADAVCCQFQETVDLLGGSARLTGCPVRAGIVGRNRAEAIARYGLDPAKRTLLVTGASSGARTVNRAVTALVRERGLPDGWQALHLTGDLDYEEVTRAYVGLGAAVAVRAYEHDMGLAYASADLAVARAGASTIAELLAAAVPTIYLPYPFHRDQHQMHQARAVEQMGAAVVVEDRPADPGGTARDLAEAVAFLAGDEARRRELAQGARAAARPDAARTVAEVLLRLADEVIERRHANIVPRRR